MGTEQKLVDPRVLDLRRAWQLRAAAVVRHNSNIMWSRVRPELDGLTASEFETKVTKIKAQIRDAGVDFNDHYSELKKRDRLQQGGPS